MGAQMLDMPRCKAVIHFWDKDVREIFKSYAAADMNVEAQGAALDSVNLTELLYMLKEGHFMDDNLSVSRVSQIFSLVNSSSEEGEGGDEDEAELVYEEFISVIVRCCDAKIPEAQRDGAPFEEVLQRWLQLSFVPTYRQLMKDKARGLIKKTL